jgi:hypothetical protein
MLTGFQEKNGEVREREQCDKFTRKEWGERRKGEMFAERFTRKEWGERMKGETFARAVYKKRKEVRGRQKCLQERFSFHKLA